MKRKTKTIRIGETLHGRIKKHVKIKGQKLEWWCEVVLEGGLRAAK